MFSVPEGRAANQPLAATTFRPPIGRVVARSAGQLGRDRFPGKSRFSDCFGRKLLQFRFLLGRGGSVDARVVRRAELRRQFPGDARPGLCRSRGDLGCQQVHDQAVFVRASKPCRRGAENSRPALSSPPKQQEPSNSPGANHLNPTGTSHNGRPKLGHHAIDHAAADQGLADGRLGSPPGPMSQQVSNRHRQEVVRVHQPADGVTIPCRSESGSLAKATSNWSFRPTKPRHGIRARAIHANLAVVIDCHEREGRIELGFTTVMSNP